MLFPKNLGPQLSIDEVALTNGELWTTLTNKAAHGKKGALVAMIQGTKASDIATVFAKLSDGARHTSPRWPWIWPRIWSWPSSNPSPALSS